MKHLNSVPNLKLLNDYFKVRLKSKKLRKKLGVT